MALVLCLCGPAARTPAQVVETPADTLGRLEARPDERPPFELPEVIVRGEDLSVITGGERVDEARPELSVGPLGRPRIPPAPQWSLPWRTRRPFRLEPRRPAAREPGAAHLRVSGTSLPGGRGHLVAGGGSPAVSRPSWRIDLLADWFDEPVPHTQRGTIEGRVEVAAGHWPRPDRWATLGEVAVRRLDWDLESLEVAGAQRFTGMRSEVSRWWRATQARLQLEAASFDPVADLPSSKWAAAGLSWTFLSKGRHPFLQQPSLSVSARGIWAEQPLRTAADPAGGLFDKAGRSEKIWRSSGALQLGTAVRPDDALSGWVGARGDWDRRRIFLAPRLLVRWQPALGNLALWSEVSSHLRCDPWWDEGRRRDFAVPDLDREAEVESPAVELGAELLHEGWRLEARMAARNLRSPRTWREDPATGLFLPATSRGRWSADGRVHIVSPVRARLHVESESGFLHDGSGEPLAFRPQIWTRWTFLGRAGSYAAAIDLEGQGRSPVTRTRSLAPWMTVSVEIGRALSSLGRVWLRVDNLTGEPARRWPFVDSSRRVFFLGWDQSWGSR